MFTTTMLVSPINENDINLLIKDLLEVFNKKIEVEEKMGKEQRFIDQQSKDVYFLKDKIAWFNQNNIIHPDLSTIRSRIEYLIDLLEQCGPHAKDLFKQKEIEVIFNNHSNTINYYIPGKVKNENLQSENDTTKTKNKSVTLSSDNKIYKIIYHYNDSLYSATMLGGEHGKKQASDAFEKFKKELAEAAKNGLTKEETTYLLEKTVFINPNVFLASLNVCNDFEAFSTLLDKLEPSMEALSNPHLRNAMNGLRFFSLVMNADARKCPSAIDFEYYKKMRTAMLLTKSQIPNGDVMRDVVLQFEHQFVESANDDQDNFSCKIQ